MSRVTEFMTRNAITVAPQDSVQHAAQLMDEFNVGSLPVCEGGRLLGMLTDRDITVRATAAGLSSALTPVDLVMSDRVRTCGPEDSVARALELMASIQIRRLPVVDAGGALLGMVSLGDFAARQSGGVQEALCGISTPSEPDRTAPPARPEPAPVPAPEPENETATGGRGW